jgi:hypothetical protein
MKITGSLNSIVEYPFDSETVLEIGNYGTHRFTSLETRKIAK